MRLAYFCFIAAALSGLTGISLGIWMGMHEDFTLAPVHAHINLLGWVTLALYGLYHRGVARRRNRLAWAQVGSSALGMPLMTGGHPPTSRPAPRRPGSSSPARCSSCSGCCCSSRCWSPTSPQPADRRPCRPPCRRDAPRRGRCRRAAPALGLGRGGWP